MPKYNICSTKIHVHTDGFQVEIVECFHDSKKCFPVEKKTHITLKPINSTCPLKPFDIVLTEWLAHIICLVSRGLIQKWLNLRSHQ
jgi:hypothetical protein